MSARDVAQRQHQTDRFVHELVVAVLNLGMHAPDAPLVRDSLRDLAATLGDLSDAQNPAPLRLVFDGDLLQVDGRDLLGPSLQAGTLMKLCEKRSIRALLFHPQTDADEFGRFLATLLDEHLRGAFHPGGRDRVERLLAARGVRHVQVELLSPFAVALPSDAEPRPAGLGDYRELTAFLHDNHIAAFRGEDLEIERANGVVEQAIKDIAQEPSSLLTLASYDDIDSFTVGHSVRVALLALHVARAAGVGKDDLVAIGTAALLHDVGKSRIPQEILLKRGPLDDDEWQVMAQHPRLGAEILVEQRHLDPRAVGAAFCHHMAPGQRGYPTPALRFEPSEVSKLVRVCDVFEALTASRPYKKALAPLEAYAVMFANAHDFDRRWLRFFARTIGAFPLGTRVRLTDGSEAVVVRHGAELLWPVVRRVATSEELPLARDPAGDELRIAGVLGADAGPDDIAATLRQMHCGLGSSCPEHAGHGQT